MGNSMLTSSQGQCKRPLSNCAIILNEGIPVDLSCEARLDWLDTLTYAHDIVVEHGSLVQKLAD